MNKEQLQTAYDSMTARCATLQNKVFSLQSDLAIFEYNKKNTICEQCGRKSRLISEEQACGKTFEMTYERENASLSLSCSKLSNKWTSIDTSPTADGEYLVVAFDSDGDACFEVADYFVDHDESISWSIDTVFIKQSDITHWMPLPSCPEIPDNCSEIPNGSKKENNNESH